MPSKPPNSGFSESDRTALDEWRREQEFERRLKERRSARWTTIRTWTQWIGGLGAMFIVLREASHYVLGFVKQWLGLP